MTPRAALPSADSFAEDPGLFDGLPTLMVVALAGFALLFLGVLAAIVVTIVRNWRYARSQGLDPLTTETALLSRAMRSQLLAPELTLEQRLDQLDDLRSRGKITEAEYAEARARLLASS